MVGEWPFCLVAKTQTIIVNVTRVLWDIEKSVGKEKGKPYLRKSEKQVHRVDLKMKRVCKAMEVPACANTRRW